MSLKAQQSESTRGTLIRVARELFTELGYADTPTEEIVRRAGMTRGALYHQYRDKKDLFRAVFECVEEELNGRITDAVQRETEPVAQMQAGIDAFLDAVLDPGVRRIVVLDGPSILGLQTWRRIDDDYSFKQVSGGLRGLVAAGLVADDRPIDALAHLIVGALNQAALAMAVAEDVALARREFGAAFEGILQTLVRGRSVDGRAGRGRGSARSRKRAERPADNRRPVR